MAKPIPTVMRNPKVEISTDGGTTWNDISGFFTSIGVDGGERQTGEVYVATEDSAVIGAGKRQPFTVTVGVVYTEGAAEPAQLVRDAWRNGTEVQLRYSPRGGASGDKMFTFEPGYITKASLPAGETSSADPVTIEFALQTADYTESTVV